MEKVELVKDYIDRITEQNKKDYATSRKKLVETRPNFFYVPKLNEMMLMQKNVTVRAKISDVELYILKRDKKLNKIDLSTLSPAQRKEYFMDNLQNYTAYTDSPVGTRLNLIDKLDYVNLLSPTINHLSVLKVHHYYRGLGLASEMINELKNETITNGYDLITAKMSPLDNFNFGDPEYQKLTEEIHKISPERPTSDPVRIDSLANIYKKMGFKVNSNYRLKDNRDISMDVMASDIKKKEKYPEYYGEFLFHDKTDILVR